MKKNTSLNKKGNNEGTNRKLLRVTHSVIFSGPLPPPEILSKYNEIVPGAAERIIKMAENQSEHRIQIEKGVIGSDIKQSSRGQFYGFVIALTGLLGSFYLILKGFEIIGVLLGGTTLVSLVSVFIYGTKSRKAEREEKEEKLTRLEEGNIRDAETETQL